jgi:hypothetical protein
MQPAQTALFAGGRQSRAPREFFRAERRRRIPAMQPAKTALFAGGRQSRAPREFFRANELADQLF